MQYKKEQKERRKALFLLKFMLIDRISGSHHIFEKENELRSISVPVHSNSDIGVFAKEILKQAKQAGMTYQQYQRLENPRKTNPTLATIEKLQKVFSRKFLAI